MKPESQPKMEAEKSGKFLELYKLERAEMEKLQERIRESDGFIRVFMHVLSYIDPANLQHPNEMKTLLVAGGVMRSENQQPIFLFENEFRVQEVINLLNQQGGLLKDTYIIPTLNGWGYPVIPNNLENRDANEYKQKAGIFFAKLLTDLGVTKIMAGGKELEVKDEQLENCLGNFIRFIQNYSEIEVKLSLGSSPLNRNSEEIRDGHPELL